MAGDRAPAGTLRRVRRPAYGSGPTAGERTGGRPVPRVRVRRGHPARARSVRHLARDGRRARRRTHRLVARLQGSGRPGPSHAPPRRRVPQDRGLRGARAARELAQDGGRSRRAEPPPREGRPGARLDPGRPRRRRGPRERADSREVPRGVRGRAPGRAGGAAGEGAHAPVAERGRRARHRCARGEVRRRPLDGSPMAHRRARAPDARDEARAVGPARRHAIRAR